MTTLFRSACGCCCSASPISRSWPGRRRRRGPEAGRELKPDVVLDLNLPGLSGLETLQLLVQDLPSCAVIILTVSEEADELGQALRDGARGYLVRTSTPRRSPARSGARRAASRSSRKA